MYSCINQYNYVYVSRSNRAVCLDTLIDKTDLISEGLLLSVYFLFNIINYFDCYIFSMWTCLGRLLFL